MKTINLLGLAALLPLLVLTTSCSEESLDTNQDQEISFGMVVGKQKVSKAKEFTYWETGQSFPVKAYMTGTTTTDVIASFELTKGGGINDWQVEPTIKQPGYSLSYYAWYPTGITGALETNSSGSNASFSYTVSVDPTTQEDLIAAASATDQATVTLNFYHLLSQVNFALQGIENVKITISDISVNEVLDAGIYTFDVNGAAGNWVTEVSTGSYGYTPIVTDTDGSNTDIIYLGNGGRTSGSYDKENALMLMPQTFEDAGVSSISFGYTLSDINNITLATGNTEVNLSDFTIAEWEMGKRYLYLIDFRDYLQGGSVNFSVAVNKWDEEGGNDEIGSLTIAQTLEIANATQTSIESAITTHNKSKLATVSLVVFPISLGESPSATITLTDFEDDFVAGDEIRINCKDNAGAQKIALDSSLVSEWTLTVVDSIVILKKNSTSPV